MVVEVMEWGPENDGYSKMSTRSRGPYSFQPTTRNQNILAIIDLFAVVEGKWLTYMFLFHEFGYFLQFELQDDFLFNDRL
jgi:hypothetical protein